MHLRIPVVFAGTQCAKGRYAAATGASSCTPCTGAGGSADHTTSTVGVGATSNASCVKVCLPDRYMSGGSNCTRCPTNSSSLLAAQAIGDCKCQSDRYMSGSTCVDCPASSGAASGAANASQCKCAAGLYMNIKSGNGSTLKYSGKSCSKLTIISSSYTVAQCAAACTVSCKEFTREFTRKGYCYTCKAVTGYTTNSRYNVYSKDTVGACAPCPAGGDSQVGSSSSAACTCPIGTFNSADLGKCTRCPGMTTTTARTSGAGGVKVCTACRQGSFKKRKWDKGCAACPPGKMNGGARRDALSCRKCPFPDRCLTANDCATDTAGTQECKIGCKPGTAGAGCGKCASAGENSATEQHYDVGGECTGCGDKTGQVRRRPLLLLSAHSCLLCPTPLLFLLLPTLLHHRRRRTFSTSGCCRSLTTSGRAAVRTILLLPLFMLLLLLVSCSC